MSDVVRTVIYDKKHIEQVVRKNPQAIKAARFLIENFPHKYKKSITTEKGIRYYTVNHIMNGHGVYYRYLVSPY
tara:strand:+ start:14 stop:235 length:222 start_codon:yes stop_codon:yes gene_type:complete